MLKPHFTILQHVDLKWTDDCAWTMVLSFSAIEPKVVRERVGPWNDLPRDNLCRACALITYMYDSDLYGCTSRHGRCVVRFVTVVYVRWSIMLAFLFGWVVYKELSALRPYSVKTPLLLHSDSNRAQQNY